MAMPSYYQGLKPHHKKPNQNSYHLQLLPKTHKNNNNNNVNDNKQGQSIGKSYQQFAYHYLASANHSRHYNRLSANHLLTMGRVCSAAYASLTNHLHNGHQDILWNFQTQQCWLKTTHTHTIVLLLFWNLSGTTRVSRYQKGKNQKGKTNLDLLEQEIVSGSGIC